MSSNPSGEKRDLVLAPGEYAFLQDETRGQIKTHVGPTVINQTAQDRPVRFDADTMTFQRCSLEQAVVKSFIASEGSYLVLENPARDNVQPEEGGSRPSPTLNTGRKVNIPGPCIFPLWPGQRARVIPGHHLKSNQFLIVRVYNEQEARNNWTKGVVATASTAGTGTQTPDKPQTGTQGEGTQQQTTAITTVTTKAPQELTIGQLLLIKGTDVSFYMPPTGIEVVPDEKGNYVREAVTLERLEYAILLDENGNKRYEKGPQVVFPEPTEQFYTENGNRKFRAIELNAIQGIHVKVIADYEEGGKQFKVGDELFITGKESSIYYPRVEHSVIRYGEKEKHYATVVPAGEARYVMDRNNGEIKTEKGPQMLLPDPRDKVIVRRVLSDKQCELWYPGNAEALNYNRSLRAMMATAPSARSGFISEGDVRSQTKKGLAASSLSSPRNIAGATAQFSASAAFPGAESAALLRSYDEADADYSSQQAVAGAESFTRGTTYTPPRTVTLDTKYDGVPAISVWTGYAVLVVNKSGKRRVVTGPDTILLDYDESLEVLELSTGKPKNTDNLQKTVYLRTQNNKVSDIVNITTKDRVQVTLKLSYRVNFEGEPEQWFSVENYVKFLCDHCRSVLKGSAQKRPVSDYDSDGVDIVRDTLLGKAGQDGSRTGLLFKENGMRVTDVEVLGIEVSDQTIAKMLNDTQHEVVRANIKLAQSERNLEITKRELQIEQDKETAATATAKAKAALKIEQLEEQAKVAEKEAANELAKVQKNKEVEGAKIDIGDQQAKALLLRKKAESDQEIAAEKARQELAAAAMKSESEAMCERFRAAGPHFAEALSALGNQATLREVAQAMSVQNLIGGRNFTEVVVSMFKDTPLAGMLSSVTDRMTAAPASNNGNGDGRLAGTGPSIPAKR